MTTRLQVWTRSIFLAVAAFCATSAHAVIMNPGQIVLLPGTTSASEPDLAGLILEDELVAFSFDANGGTISGQVQVRVVRSDLDNTLDFYWRVLNDASSAGVIGSFRIGEFESTTYDANYRIDGVGTAAPNSARRFTGAQDSYVNFNFFEALSPGTSSRFMFLDTDALTYARTAFYDLTNINQTQISGPFSTWAPSIVTAVPEPGMIALFVLGIALLMFASRLQMRTKQVRR